MSRIEVNTISCMRYWFVVYLVFEETCDSCVFSYDTVAFSCSLSSEFEWFVKMGHPENINALAFSRQKVLVPVKVHMGDDACGVETVPIKQIPSSGGEEDVEVDIIGCSNLGKASLMEDSCEDAPECSSSFGDTGAGTENAASFSDTEVESRKRVDDPSSSKCDDQFESCQGRYFSLWIVSGTCSLYKKQEYRNGRK